MRKLLFALGALAGFLFASQPLSACGDNPSADQRAAAEKEYSCLVAPAKKNYDLLKVIDRAMVTRPESSGAKCQKQRA